MCVTKRGPILGTWAGDVSPENWGSGFKQTVTIKNLRITCINGCYAHDQRAHDPIMKRIMDMRRKYRAHDNGYAHGQKEIFISFQKR